jgi:hypothetical protein
VSEPLRKDKAMAESSSWGESKVLPLAFPENTRVEVLFSQDEKNHGSHLQ